MDHLTQSPHLGEDDGVAVDVFVFGHALATQTDALEAMIGGKLGALGHA